MFAMPPAMTTVPTSGASTSHCWPIRFHGTNIITEPIATQASVVRTATNSLRIVSGCVTHRITPPTAPSQNATAPTARNVASSPGSSVCDRSVAFTTTCYRSDVRHTL